MVIAISTDYWEDIKYKPDMLRTLDNLVLNESTFNDKEGFYVLTLDQKVENNVTRVVFYLRDTYGGIWRMCDRISGKLHIYTSGESVLTHICSYAYSS